MEPRLGESGIEGVDGGPCRAPDARRFPKLTAMSEPVHRAAIARPPASGAASTPRGPR